MSKRVIPVVLVLSVAVVLAGAPAPAQGSAREVQQRAASGPGDLQVPGVDGPDIAVHGDLSRGEVTLRFGTTGAGVPVIVSGVAAGRGEGPEELRQLGIGYAATPHDVTLAWTPVPGAREYAVRRDGALLGVTARPRFVDRRVSAGARYRYTVDAAVQLQPEPVVDPGTGETVYPDRWTGYLLHVPVAVPPHDAGALAAATERLTAASAAQSSSTFTYKSFIEEAAAPGFPCVPWPVDTYFGGDEREWVSGPGGGSRTVMTATAHWDTASLATSSAVGATVNYYDDGTVREVRTASSSGMSFLDVDVTPTRASFRIDHSATNPFCESIGGEIRYNVAVSVYSSGVYFLTGWRRPAPHHEAYVRHDGGAWQTVLQRTNSGFHCLTGVCGTEGLNEVGHY